MEFLGTEPEAADNKSHTQNKQKVAKQTTEERALDQIEVAFTQSNSGDNKLDDVSQSRVQQTANGLASPQRDLLSSETQKGSERNNSKSGNDECDGFGLMSPM